MFLIPLAQKLLQNVGALHTRNQVIGNEVNIAPIPFGPGTFLGERAGKRSFIEWHSRDYRRVCLLTCRKQLVFRILIEDVVDHLDGIDLAGSDSAQTVPRLPTVQTNSDCFDEPLTAQIVKLVEPAIIT